jgi:hypothetical protein
VHRPPRLSNPDRIDEYLKALDLKPRLGPSFVVAGDAQQLLGGPRHRQLYGASMLPW